MPYFHEVVAQHPKMLRHRPDLSFSRGGAPSAIADKWRRDGVVLLREVLSPDMLAGCRQVFSQFIETEIKKSGDAQSPDNAAPPTFDEGPRPEWENGETIHGSWHVPWIIRHGGQSPTSNVLSALITSWAWPVIEEICQSKDIVVMLGLCLGRHNIDQPLLVGAHQDATAVNPEVPLSIWIPLQEVAPMRDSGLGFVVPSPDHVIPAEPNNDIGSSYFMDQLGKMWIPHYQAGDLTIHSKFSPHFTTGYGTMSDRYSLEIRLWAREDAFLKYYDPSIRVGRLNGFPVITETKCSPGVRAHGFVASTAVLAMQTISAMPPPPKPAESEAPSPQGIMATLRDAARRLVSSANR
ncbi:MAG: hypothetical protein K2X72_40930 [Reyranella sp.]|nr:hypothetical protein [Reyranella sp.]